MELEEEKKDKAYRERRLAEQAKKIANLSSLVLCSERDEKSTNLRKVIPLLFPFLFHVQIHLFYWKLSLMSFYNALPWYLFPNGNLLLCYPFLYLLVLSVSFECLENALSIGQH